LGGPPLSRAYKPRDEVVPSNFRRFYDRGDLPIAIEHAPVVNKVAWKVSSSFVDMACGLRQAFKVILRPNVRFSSSTMQNNCCKFGKHKQYDLDTMIVNQT